MIVVNSTNTGDYYAYTRSYYADKFNSYGVGTLGSGGTTVVDGPSVANYTTQDATGVTVSYDPHPTETSIDGGVGTYSNSISTQTIGGYTEGSSTTLGDADFSHTYTTTTLVNFYTTSVYTGYSYGTTGPDLIYNEYSGLAQDNSTDTTLTIGTTTERFTSTDNLGGTYDSTQTAAADRETDLTKVFLATEEIVSVMYDGSTHMGYGVDYILVGENEWLWQFVGNDPDANAVYELNQIANLVANNSTWVPVGSDNTVMTTLDYPAVDNIYPVITWYYVTSEGTSAEVDTFITTTSGTGNRPDDVISYEAYVPAIGPVTYTTNTGKPPCILGQPITNSWTGDTTLTSSSSSTFQYAATTAQGSQGYASDTDGNPDYGSIILVNPPMAWGTSSVGSTKVTLSSIFTVPSYTYDDQGRITAFTTSTIYNQFTTWATFAENAGGYFFSTTTSTSTLDDSSHLTSTETSVTTFDASSYILPTAVNGVLFEQEIGYASVLEATISSGYCFESGSKCDVLIGPASTWYYPFFSQEWQGLWLPVTYANTATAALSTTTVVASYDFGDGYIYTAIDNTDTIETKFTFSWDNTHTDTAASFGKVWITASWISTTSTTGWYWGITTTIATTVTTASTTEETTSAGGTTSITTDTTIAMPTSSVSTSFVIRTMQDNDYSFLTTTLYPGGNRGQSPNTYYGDFAIGGQQWSSNKATAVLHRGIWGATTVDSLGSTVSEKFTVTDWTTVEASGSSAVWYRALPYWQARGVYPQASSGNLTLLYGADYDLIHTSY